MIVIITISFLLGFTNTISLRHLSLVLSFASL